MKSLIVTIIAIVVLTALPAFAQTPKPAPKPGLRQKPPGATRICKAHGPAMTALAHP